MVRLPINLCSLQSDDLQTLFQDTADLDCQSYCVLNPGTLTLRVYAQQNMSGSISCRCAFLGTG